MKKKPSPEEAQMSQAGNYLSSAATGLNPYLAGSQGMSDFRRGALSQGSSAIATSGENALSRIRNRAQAAGFGGMGQPITFGAEAGLQGQLQQQAAQLPFEVQKAAAPLEMGAAQQLAGIGGQQTNLARLYYDKAEAARKRKAGLWGGLAKAGLGIATGGLSLPFTGVPFAGGGDMSMGAGY
jgi:hypothetical protein